MMFGRRASRGWRVPVALLALCVVLGTVLIAVVTGGEAPTSDAVTSSRAVPLGSTADAELDGPAEPFALPPAQAFRNVIERPLFHASRQPIVSEAPAATAITAADKPDFVLRGTIVVAGGERLALLEAGGTQKTVRQGDNLQGWSVAAVESGRVVMERSGNTAVYSLDDTLRKVAIDAKANRLEQRRRERAALRAREREEQLDNEHFTEQ